MNILGLNCGYNGSACVVVNGQIKSYFKTGSNMERGINKLVIKKALDEVGLKLKNIDMAAVVNWYSDRMPDGTECWDKNEEGFSITKENGIEFSLQDYYDFYQNPSQVAIGTFTLNIDTQTVPCMVVDHLFAHCAYSYLTSPFDNCMAVCIDPQDGYAASNAIYWMQDVDKSFKLCRRDQQFAPINTYTSFTDFLGMWPAVENFNALEELAGDQRDESVKHWAWPHNIQMGNIFHGDQWMGLLSYNKIEHIPQVNGFYPPLSDEGIEQDGWFDASDVSTLDRRKEIATSVMTVVEDSIRNYINEIKKFGINVAIGGKVTMFKKLVEELKDDKTFFTKPNNDDELSAAGALFLADQLMKTKRNEITSNTKTKITSKEI